MRRLWWYNSLGNSHTSPAAGRNNAPVGVARAHEHQPFELERSHKLAPLCRPMALPQLSECWK